MYIHSTGEAFVCSLRCRRQANDIWLGKREVWHTRTAQCPRDVPSRESTSARCTTHPPYPLRPGCPKIDASSTLRGPHVNTLFAGFRPMSVEKSTALVLGSAWLKPGCTIPFVINDAVSRLPIPTQIWIDCSHAYPCLPISCTSQTSPTDDAIILPVELGRRHAEYPVYQDTVQEDALLRTCAQPLVSTRVHPTTRHTAQCSRDNPRPFQSRPRRSLTNARAKRRGFSAFRLLLKENWAELTVRGTAGVIPSLTIDTAKTVDMAC